MPELGLAARVKDYLARQIAWTELVLEELGHLDQDLAGKELDVLLDRQSRHEKEMEGLAREYHGLQQEWAQAEVRREERSEVRALSKRAQELAAALRRRYDEAVEMAEAALVESSGQRRALRRGRDMLGKYRPGLEEGPGFIDKKA